MANRCPAAAQTSRRGSCVRRTRLPAGLSRGRCSLRHAGWLSGRQREPWGVGISSGGPSPAGPWSRMVGVCLSSTASARMPRATAGPPGSQHQEACNNCTCRRGSSPARPSPACLLPTVPGAAGQPGVPAAAVWACRAAEPLPVRGSARPVSPHSTGPPAAWTGPPGLLSWILSLPVTLCPPRDLALALVPGHPCLSLATSTPTLGFPGAEA